MVVCVRDGDTCNNKNQEEEEQSRDREWQLHAETIRSGCAQGSSAEAERNITFFNHMLSTKMKGR